MQHYHSNRYRSKKFSNQSTSLLLGIIYQESDSQNLFFARKLKTSKHRSSVSILTLVKPPKSPPLPSPQLKQPVPKLLVLLCHNNQYVPVTPTPNTITTTSNYSCCYKSKYTDIKFCYFTQNTETLKNYYTIDSFYPYSSMYWLEE